MRRTFALCRRDDVCCRLHAFWDLCAGSSNFSSLVVMSKGTSYTQQSYKCADTFPFEWIKKKWKENFHVTCMATAGGEKNSQWTVVMSRSSGFTSQCIELDFQYPSEGVHRRWDAGINFDRIQSLSTSASDDNEAVATYYYPYTELTSYVEVEFTDQHIDLLCCIWVTCSKTTGSAN